MKDSMIPVETIQKAIYLIRGQNIILDRDLAAMYGVPTTVLKQAVRRNALRFPSDFMFVLSREEFADWRSQFVTSKTELRGGTRYMPMAFTEQGVAMLSSVLNSERAIQVNIAIIRTFTQMRQSVAEPRDDGSTFSRGRTNRQIRGGAFMMVRGNCLFCCHEVFAEAKCLESRHFSRQSVAKRIYAL